MSNQQMRSVVLADKSQRVPWPGVPGRLLPQGDEPFEVSILNPVFATMLADKTLIPPPPPPEPPAKPDGKAKA
jgi:hypothetical protein